MKLNKFMLLLSLLCVFILSCNKEDSGSKEELSVIEVGYSGCFLLKSNSSTADSIGMTDSLYYCIDSSILTLHINKVFACCSSLKDSVAIKDNIMCIYLSNNDQMSIACNCICDYHYEYSLKNFFQKNVSFKVYIKGFLDDDYLLWKQTKFIDGLD